MDSISNQNEKLNYPKSTWLILSNEVCERFTYFGMRTVLILYLTTILKFNGDDSTIVYHSFIFLTYFMALPGAILADSYWGKFKTIISFSLVYAMGTIVLAGASMAHMFSLNVQKTFALMGLFFVSVGTGGIKPCVYTFGGEQFRLPQQNQLLLQYSNNFTTAMVVGALFSTVLTPVLRHGVHCLGRDTCFPLAFGVPAVLMFAAIAIFVSGKNMYVNVKKKPERNVISRTFGCIFYALRAKTTSAVPSNNHWLEHAKGRYTEAEITDTESVLNVISVFVAYPIFWSLYEQAGSRWTLQATAMDGRVDYLGLTIQPDQMHTLIPIFALAFLVLYDVTLHPMMAVVGIRKPIQKLAFSGLLAVVAYAFAGLLQFTIYGITTEIPSGQGRLNIYNGFDCHVFVRSESLNVQQGHIGPLEMINVSRAVPSREDVAVITFGFGPECPYLADNYEFDTTVTVIGGAEISYHLDPKTVALNRVGIRDHLVKEKIGAPNIRILIDHTFEYDDNITLASADKYSLTSYSLYWFRGMNFNAVKVGKYNVIYNGKILTTTTMDLMPATFYTLTLQRNGDRTDVRLFTKDEGNYIHMMWQVPQYLFQSIADVIFMANTLEFAFVEAPINIKSFVSAMNMWTLALGNLLVVFISSISIRNQAHEYLLYSGLMFADTLLLAYFSVVYRSKNSSAIYIDATALIEYQKEEGIDVVD